MLFINDGFILTRRKLHTGRIQEKEQMQQEEEAKTKAKYDWSGLEYYSSPLLETLVEEVSLEAGPLKTVRKRMWEKKDLVIHQMESRRDNQS